MLPTFSSGEVGQRNSPQPDSHRLFAQLGQLNLPLYLDTWDGYPAARERFYKQCRAAGASDLIVLTGDSPCIFWANQLFNDAGQRMGVELGTARITSPGDFENYGQKPSLPSDRLVAEHNQEVTWTDCTRRGFVKLVLTPDSAKADYIVVDNVKTRQYGSYILRKHVKSEAIVWVSLQSIQQDELL